MLRALPLGGRSVNSTLGVEHDAIVTARSLRAHGAVNDITPHPLGVTQERVSETAATGDDDAELVARYRRGESQAFDELVRRHQRGLARLCRRYVRCDDDARELCQRALVRAFQSLADLRGGQSFRSWLYKIAVNLSLNHLRDRRPPAPLTDDVLVGEAVGAARLEDAETRARLHAALGWLPPADPASGIARAAASQAQ